MKVLYLTILVAVCLMMATNHVGATYKKMGQKCCEFTTRRVCYNRCRTITNFCVKWCYPWEIENNSGRVRVEEPRTTREPRLWPSA